MEALTKLDGLLLLGGYFLAMIATVSFLRKKETTKSGYLVADRNAPWT